LLLIFNLYSEEIFKDDGNSAEWRMNEVSSKYNLEIKTTKTKFMGISRETGGRLTINNTPIDRVHLSANHDR